MIKFSRGDIVKVDLDGAKGHETQNDSKINSRLCLVIQNERGNQVSPLAIVAPITGIDQFKSLPVQVAVRGADLGPLHQDSSIECGQIRTIDRGTRVISNIGKLSEGIMELVDAAIKKSLGLT